MTRHQAPRSSQPLLDESDTRPDPAVVQTLGVPRIRDLLPSLGRALGRFALAGILPMAVFYVAFRLAGPAVGIACGMGLSLAALLVQLRRLGRLDPVVIVPMAVILIQGTAALLLGSIDLYLAAPAVENMLWGTAMIGSVLLKRPLVRIIASELELIPSAYADSVVLGRALEHVTIAWSLGAFAKAIARLWLLTVLPLELFLVAVTALNLAVNGSLFVYSVWWPLRAARRAHASGSA